MLKPWEIIPKFHYRKTKSILIFKHAQRQQVEKKRLHDEFNVATGLFRSRAVFAIGAIGGRSNPEGATETSPNETVRSEDDHALTAIPQNTIGPNSDKNVFTDKPMQKRILRKVNYRSC